MKNQAPKTQPNAAPRLFALLFGAFLGLALLKFGNPVILNDRISAPSGLSETWQNAWPPAWSCWLLAPLIIAGTLLTLVKRSTWPGKRLLWLLPLIWFLWQLLSATRSVDPALTLVTLGQLGGCVACYFIGALVLGKRSHLPWLLAGLQTALVICLVRAVDQHLFEFPQEKQMLLEGQRTGWTNLPPAVVLEMRSEGMILNTNGMDIANPALLVKYEKNRSFGTLVYPNALAGAILLLLPSALVMAFSGTHRFRRLTRGALIGLTLFLGLGALFWSGSKSGWLIALGLFGLWLTGRLDWPARTKAGLIGSILLVGLVLFGFRFHHYLASGATSLGARFDYWRAAVQTAAEHPLVGTGPGTFQRPYALLKAPASEMARLTHNDFLEQFCDSGLVGGAAYLSWVSFLLITLQRRFSRSGDPLLLAVLLGLLGWFIQGLGEFELYIPALGWTAFTLAGTALSLTANELDKTRPER